MTKLSGVRHGKREFKAYSLALSLAHRMLMLASTAASAPSDQQCLIGGRPLGLLAMICYGGSLSQKLLLGVRRADSRQE